jgi:hypothetical protein
VPVGGTFIASAFAIYYGQANYDDIGGHLCCASSVAFTAFVFPTIHKRDVYSIDGFLCISSWLSFHPQWCNNATTGYL